MLILTQTWLATQEPQNIPTLCMAYKVCQPLEILFKKKIILI